ncbi:MAG: DEAD/DEAH box helicase [Alphaproteobacteria bacterium]
MKLRPHQVLAYNMVKASIGSGHRRPIIAAPCGFGKTYTAVDILTKAASKGNRGIFICDRIKLVDQAIEAFHASGIEVGVIQGEHRLSNPDAQIQIASIQTLLRRKRKPIFHVAIVDECHIHYKGLTQLMSDYSAVPFIGLSATPYSKGLGKHYDDLIVPITSEELIRQKYLVPARYFAGHAPDLKGVGRKYTQTGARDWDPKQLSRAVEKDQKLVGDIIKNWQKYGQDRQTIAFSPSIKHSQTMVEMFRSAGISAEHIDGYMDVEERQWIYDAHDKGEFKILSCSRLLNTGYDAPRVSCMIDAFPTASLVTWVQRCGRVLRTCEGKVDAIILDHAGNTRKHGFAECAVPFSLDDGEGRYSERSTTKDKKEPVVKKCPECWQEFLAPRCQCGYVMKSFAKLDSDQQILKELSRNNRKTDMQRKREILGQFQLHARMRGFKPGWASHAYRQKFGVWPNKVDAAPVSYIDEDVMNFIKYLRIKGIKGVRSDLRQAS